MTAFTVYTLETAPAASKPLLEASIKAFGRIPNLHGVMAEAPAMLEAYQTVGRLFENSSLNAEDITVVWQTANVEHGCLYCVPAHTAMAHMMKVDPSITEALRNRQPMPLEKLQVLHETTLLLIQNRGHLTAAEIERFLAAGYTKQQLLEVILEIAMKVMSNYVNHIAHTPIDKPFEKFLWK